MHLWDFYPGQASTGTWASGMHYCSDTITGLTKTKPKEGFFREKKINKNQVWRQPYIPNFIEKSNWIGVDKKGLHRCPFPVSFPSFWSQGTRTHNVCFMGNITVHTCTCDGVSYYNTNTKGIHFPAIHCRNIKSVCKENVTAVPLCILVQTPFIGKPDVLYMYSCARRFKQASELQLQHFSQDARRGKQIPM